jgi:hypothetical protein
MQRWTFGDSGQACGAHTEKEKGTGLKTRHYRAVITASVNSWVFAVPPRSRVLCLPER